MVGLSEWFWFCMKLVYAKIEIILYYLSILYQEMYEEAMMCVALRTHIKNNSPHIQIFETRQKRLNHKNVSINNRLSIESYNSIENN